MRNRTRILGAPVILKIVLLGLLPSISLSTTEPPATSVKEVDKAYGIDEILMRWDSSIQLVYSTLNSPLAPEGFSSADPLPGWIENAANIWERVSGVTFNPIFINDDVVPETDVTSCAEFDRAVSITWEEQESSKATAGPRACGYDLDKGRYEVLDGAIKLNIDADWSLSYAINRNYDTDKALTHEIGHLIGLGHSNSPISMMYANPYNYINLPQQDDIRALQVMYGRGRAFVDPPSLALEWGLPQRFSENKIFETLPEPTNTEVPGLYFYNQDLEEWETGRGKFQNLSKEDFLAGNFYFIGWTDLYVDQASADVERDYEIHFTDEYGNSIRSTKYRTECRYFRVIEDDGWCSIGILRTIPSKSMLSVGGAIKKYFILSDNKIIFEEEISVDQDNLAINDSPSSTIKITQGKNDQELVFKVSAEDSGENDLQVTLMPPGKRNRDGDSYFDTSVVASLENGASINMPINLGGTGWHKFFVDVSDTELRYGLNAEKETDDGNTTSGGSYAGSGFQTLSRLVVHTPLDDFPIRSYIVDTNNVYIEQPSTEYISAGRAIKIKDPSPTAAQISFSTAKNNDWSIGNNPKEFSTNDFINLVAKIDADELDIGSEVEFFIALKSKNTSGTRLYYMNSDRTLTSWNGSIPRLEPIWTMKESDNLPSYRKVWDFEVVQGQMNEGEHTFFVGYRNSEVDGPIHVHSKGFKIRVTEN